MGMKAGVITFPGSNCDRDMLYILKEFFGADARLLWYREPIHEDFDVLVVPGGFSYGDYLRAGAIARVAPAMLSLAEHVKRGGPAFGICNGFQILCETQLLPGALIRNTSLKHICKDVRLVANPKNAFARDLDANREYVVPVSHGEGNYRIDDDGLKSLQDNDQIVIRYAGENPNGSVDDIAGVSDASGRVLGMMPHPERATDPAVGGTDGRDVLAAILANVVARV